MNNFLLKRELSKHICQNLGATPSLLSRNVSLTHNNLLQKRTIKLDDLANEIKTWHGFIGVESDRVTCLLTIIETDSEFDVYAIFHRQNAFSESDSRNVIGFAFDVLNQDDDGLLVKKIGDKWVSLSLPDRLLLSLFFEQITSDGLLWAACLPSEVEEYEDLYSLLDFASTGDTVPHAQAE